METTVNVNNTTITTNVTDGANISVTQQSPIDIPVTTTESVLSVSTQAQVSMPVSFADTITIEGSSPSYFRGNWDTWADVPTNSDNYPADTKGNKTPQESDILVVINSVGYGSQYEGKWLFYYEGTWSSVGKNGWKPKYSLGEELTEAQKAALNSGITGMTDSLGTSSTLAASQNLANELNNKILAIASGASVSVTTSPRTIYKNTSTGVTISGSITKVTPTSLKLYADSTSGEPIKTETGVSSISYTYTYSLSDNKTFYIVADYNGMQFTSSVILYAKYPIYAGFGTSAEGVAVSANKLSARTSAAGTYSGTAATNGVYYYILVPTDISALSSFTMGGAPFVMNQTTETIGSITYRVYKSGSIYNTGATVEIKAQ